MRGTLIDLPCLAKPYDTDLQSSLSPVVYTGKTPQEGGDHAAMHDELHSSFFGDAAFPPRTNPLKSEAGQWAFIDHVPQAAFCCIWVFYLTAYGRGHLWANLAAR
jgi:hypothetical protein